MSPNRKLWKWGAIAVLGSIAIGSLAYPRIQERFGPMSQVESQCLLCQRNRVELWVCGNKRLDVVSSNEYSNWVDSFFPPTHSHLWSKHTGYYRGEWFGSKSIGCGGDDTVARIFDQRMKMGEKPAQQLLLKWHQLVQSVDLKKYSREDQLTLRAFREKVVNEPAALLQGE